MMQQVAKIDWSNIIVAVPCFACITMMGFAYSISEGIAFGVMSWVIMHLLAGQNKESSVLMYVLAVVFFLKYFLI